MLTLASLRSDKWTASLELVDDFIGIRRPPLLLHTVLNALTLTLLLEGFIAFQGSSEAIFTPGMGGILGTVLITLVGLGLYLRRTRASS